MQNFWFSLSPAPPNFLYSSPSLCLSPHSLLFHLSLLTPLFLLLPIFRFTFMYSAITEIIGVEKGVELERASVINLPYKKNKGH